MTDSGKASDRMPRDVDVVVVGAGGGGLAAAVAAAEKGARVALLEKRGPAGGNTAFAQGLLGTETRVQKQADLLVTKDEAFKVAMEYSHL